MNESSWLVGKIDNRNCRRLRPNLRWTRQNAASQVWWILSDPINNRHFRCEHLEARVMQVLDGKRSFGDITIALTKEFPASELSKSKIVSILRFAQANALLMPLQSKTYNRDEPKTLPGKASRLTSTIYGLRGALLSLVYQRIPLGNPNRIAAQLAERTDWLFGRNAVQMWVGFLLTSFAVLLVSVFRVDPDTWESALSLSSISDWRLWLGGFLVFGATRVLHEAAHAIVCVRQGARCNQIGIMRIMFIAFPYVDVSDAWRIADRHARMAVFAAGIYVDLIIASIAVWLWQGTEAGYVHNLSLMTLGMGLTGSVLFNANPLMKYDGYHVLSEWLELADLQKSSRSIYQSWIGGLIAGKRHGRSMLHERSGIIQLLLAVYAPASQAYRMSLAFGISMAILMAFHAWHLTEIGWTFIGMSVVLGISATADKQFRSQGSPYDHMAKGESSLDRRWLRTCIRGAMWIGVLLCSGFCSVIPLPERVHAIGIVATQDRQPVYVNAPTTTLQSVTQNGFTEIRLSSETIDAELMRIRQGIEETRAKQAALQHAVYFEPKLFSQLPQIETIRQLRQRRYEFLESQRRDFHLSIQEGRQFLACPLPRPQIEVHWANHGVVAHEKLTPYATLLNPLLLGSRLERGTLVGYACSVDRKPSVEVQLAQADRASVHVGQVAKVRLQQYPLQVFKASVKSISQLINDHQQEQNNRTLPESPPEEAHYQVDLVFEGSFEELPFVENGHAEVVFATRGKSLYAHFVDYANRITR